MNLFQNKLGTLWNATRGVSKNVNLFRKYFQLTKVTIVSNVDFDFKSKVYYGFN
jgi:hypothetical protein